MMICGHYKEVDPMDMTGHGTCKTEMRWLLCPDSGTPVFSMRVVTIQPGGFVGMHEHPNEHEIFVLSGTGCAKTHTESVDLNPGDYLFVPPDAGEHSFINTGDDVFEFICCIPNPK